VTSIAVYNLFLETQRRVTRAALAITILLTTAVVAIQSAQAQTFNVLYSFKGKHDGSWPTTGVIRDAEGNLYGTTYSGGKYNLGTVFKLDKTGKETVLHHFKGSPRDGANPLAGLLRDAEGNLYGTTSLGGSAPYGGVGAVFKISTNGKETVLYNFTGTGADGAIPQAALLRDPRGDLYGTTLLGGVYDFGTVFKLDKTGAETTLYSFAGLDMWDGAYPYAPLVRDKEGNLYGTTAQGGIVDGTVFKLDKNGQETVLWGFSDADGAEPCAGLVLDANGTLYGTTLYGGPYMDYGTVFRVDTTGDNFAVIHDFSWTDGDGAYPGTPLILDAQGNLYGTTGADGWCNESSNCATVFKLDPAGNETVLYTFTGGPEGQGFASGLLRDRRGNLYGTLAGNPGNNQGTVFKLAP
jgi:uncharacterized repeat protein (TIGR03803 family)